MPQRFFAAPAVLPMTVALIVVFVTASPAALTPGATTGAVFQYAVPVETERGPSEALLWIPPEADRVRGVVIAAMTLMEGHFVQDARVRKACADEQLAVLFLRPGLGAVDPQKVLDDLAGISGYVEMSVAPVMFVGHSANGPPALLRAAAMADRCFGLIQYRGGGPWGDPPLPPGIPALVMLGQFDEFGRTMRSEEGRETWEGGRDAMARFRAENPANLGAVVVEPGAGHFAWSDRNAWYVAMFLRKAAAARIPKSWPADARRPVVLHEIDPATGWLSDLTINKPGPAPAVWNDYQGDRAWTNWHFDRETAEATAAYHEGIDRRDQFLRWEDRYWVDAGARFFFHEIHWVGDGQTFRVHPAYRDTYPGQYNGLGPLWPKAGEPVGHSGAPIRVKPVGGALVAVGSDTLRIQYHALAPATAPGRFTFMAYSEGDKQYRYTELVGMLPRGFSGLSTGREQTITLPPIDDVPADGAPVTLGATSDAGLPVEYYVAHGPAVVEGSTLKIAQVPSRAKFPIEVKVVAWQFGRGVEPLVRTAAPVERTFRIVAGKTRGGTP